MTYHSNTSTFIEKQFDKFVKLYHEQILSYVEYLKQPFVSDDNIKSRGNLDQLDYINDLEIDISLLIKNFSNFYISSKVAEINRERLANGYSSIDIKDYDESQDYTIPYKRRSYIEQELYEDGYHEGLAIQLREGHIEMNELDREDQEIIRGSFGNF